MDATKIILERFEQLSAVPRASKQEQKVAAWLQSWAKQQGFSSKSDAAGNLVIYVPASTGLEKAPTIVVQGHMDMVCERATDSKHDFSKDPIRNIRDGEWLRADKTTLGADDGIAIAMAMVLAESKEVAHPPLELLCTVAEEIGLIGASALDTKLISGKILLNVDAEEEGVLIVGCAGSMTNLIHLPVAREALPAGQEVRRLTVGGGKGGHSGMDIQKNRANANKIVARVLDRIEQQVPIRLVSLKGGSARNAIARDAEATFAFPKEMAAKVNEEFAGIKKECDVEYAKTDSGLTITLAADGKADASKALSPDSTKRLLKLMMGLPHGPIQMTPGNEEFVETSLNMGVVELKEDGLHLTTSERSMSMSRLNEINRRVEAIAELAGAKVEGIVGYPSWPPNMDSVVLKKAVESYEALFKVKPKVELVHAGLECGVIGANAGGMDMLSLGPTIKDVHSPSEKLNIPSLEKVWKLLVELIGRLSK